MCPLGFIFAVRRSNCLFMNVTLFNYSWLPFRFNFVASTSELHLLKMEFLELKYRLLSLLVFAESKLKSWIIKYGRRESVELLLQNYIVSLPCFVFECIGITLNTVSAILYVHLKYPINTPPFCCNYILKSKWASKQNDIFYFQKN